MQQLTITLTHPHVHSSFTHTIISGAVLMVVAGGTAATLDVLIKNDAG